MSEAREVKWDTYGPSTQEQILLIEQRFLFPLPSSYVQFLKTQGAGTGNLGIFPGYIEMWNAEEMLTLNELYEVEKNPDRLLGFGTNGAGEFFMFQKEQASVFLIHSVNFDFSEAIIVSNSFNDFAAQLGLLFDDDTL